MTNTARAASRRLAAAICLLLPLFFGGAATAADTVTISDAWSRALPPVVKVGAAYLTIANAGSQGEVLVSADASIAERVELHEHAHVDGMMQMRQVTSVPVPPGASVAFKPHGLHLMLFGLKAPLKAGSHFELTLHLESGKRLQVTVPVLKEAP